MNSSTIANGRPVVIAAVCSATSPPPISSVAATTPSVTAQNTRCGMGGSASPPAVMMSMTRDPESELVTKKLTTTITPSSEVTSANGKASRNTNSDTGMFSCTAVARPPGPKRSTQSAPSPNTVIHANVTNVGTSSTPRMNSRTVRPLLTRAMNIPTNGDQAIHQPQ